MKKDVFIGGIALIILTVLITLLIKEDTMRQPQIEIIEWHYKGHDMIKYKQGYSVSVCHSPVCKKCIQIYD